MVDVQELEREIAALKAGKTTYPVIEKLAMLYTVRDAMTAESEPVRIAPASFAPAPQSDFLRAASSAPVDGLLSVLDEHMEAIKALYPKEYAAVVRRIIEL